MLAARARGILVITALGFTACSRPATDEVPVPDPPSPQDPDDETDVEVSRPLEHRFDVAIEWPTPSLVDLPAGLTSAEPLRAGGVWATFDIDGDLRPDLVSFASGVDGRQHGLGASPHWLVYQNTGVAFSNAPMMWRTPDLGYPNGLDKRGPPRSAVKSDWRTFDIDGDHRPDLVSFVVPDTGLQHGVETRPHWQVYLNTGDGFEASPIEWPTPSFPELSRGIFDDQHLGRLEGDLGRHEGSWSTFDINGDHRPDLVSFCFDFVLGQHGLSQDPHWKVYLNTGAGFAESAIEWMTPSVGNPTRGLWAASFDDQSWGYWDTLDINGDGRPDLLSFAPTDGSGQYGHGTNPHWLVFENTGDGFAETPQPWATPAAPAATRGFHMDAHASFTFGHWRSFDLDGDRRADLVYLAPPGTEQFGWPVEPHWRVYPNEGAAFATMPILQSMPTADVVPSGIYTPSIVTSGGAAWSTFDIDGDGRPDIVQFVGSDGPPQFGWPSRPHWRVYRNL